MDVNDSRPQDAAHIAKEELAVTAALPERAAVVVIGGGVIGTSIAFHLAEAGVDDVLLLDSGPLGGGSTCKAAGGVRAMFSDEVNILLGQRSLEALARFGERPGQEIDLHRVGYLFLLEQPEHVRAMTAAVELQNALGMPSRMIAPEEAQRHSPLISTDGLLAAAWSPTDGHCTPESVVLGYATGARRLGATLLPHCPVTGLRTDAGAITGVGTDRGTVTTDTVICAAGAWSQQVAGMAGVHLPVTPLRRQIVLTEPVPDLPRDLPMTIDFSTSFYFHGEGHGLLMGMSDPDEQPGFHLDRSDGWFPRLGDAVARRAPRLAEVGLSSGWAGLYEMTPDHNALIGEASGISRFLYATGFSGHGFLMGPAVGEVVRDLFLHRQPPVDVTGLSVDRLLVGDLRPEHNVV
jgi:sarcosine oxidase subunit beta